MRLFRLVFIFLIAMITPAFAEDHPVKDRCADHDVLVTVFELMEKNYPPRYADKTSFIFDPDSILTKAYDPNLDKVTCQAKFSLIPDLVDGTKSSWVLAASKAGIKQMPKLLVYEMQYVSGSTERFNVRLNEILNIWKD